MKDPGASITWAREIRNLNRKLLTPTVVDTIVRKINKREITNSKDIRTLRLVLRDPVGKDEFFSETGTVESALSKIRPSAPARPKGLAGDVQALLESIRSRPWTGLEESRGDLDLLKQINEAEKTLSVLRRQLDDSDNR